MKLFKLGVKFLKIFAYLVLKGKFLNNFKNLKISSETCYVLGNGPSLAVSLKNSKIENQKNIFVVNNFVLSEHYCLLKPKYYVFADPGYWDDTSHFEEYLKSQAILQKIANETNWEINIIAPISAEKCFRKHFSTKNNFKLYFVNKYCIDSKHKFVYFLYENYYTCPCFQNVIVLVTFLALNFGFKEINLLGVEHSWTENIRVNKENQVCLSDKHFYEIEAKLSPWIKLDGSVYKMSEILTDLSKMFRGYYYLKYYAKYKKAIIYNCTPNSYIDAFERKLL